MVPDVPSVTVTVLVVIRSVLDVRGSARDVDRSLVVLVLELLVSVVTVVLVLVLELPGFWCHCRIDVRTKAPEVVSWLTSHLPFAPDPGRSAAHFSSLSLIAQLASEMRCSFKKSSHL